MEECAKPGIKIGKGLGEVSEATLRFCRQIGVEEVGMPSQLNRRPGSGSANRPMSASIRSSPSAADASGARIARTRKARAVMSHAPAYQAIFRRSGRSAPRTA